MSSLLSIIQANRPNIKLSTAKSYRSTINVIGTSIGKSLTTPAEIASNIQSIYNTFNDSLTPQVQRIRQTSLLVSLDDKSGKYKDIVSQLRKLMINNADKYQKVIDEHKKTDKQKSGWEDWSTVVEKYNKLQKEVMPFFKKDAVLSKHDFFKLQMFVVLSLYVLIPPGRSEYVHFKIRNINDSTDNYMRGLTFVFNNYKTFTKYGRLTVKIPTTLKNIINKWATINKSDYLIVGNDRMKGIGASQLNRMFNNYFGKNLGPSLLRHIFNTHKFRDGATYKEMKQVAHDMKHSVEQGQEEYLKTN